MYLERHDKFGKQPLAARQLLAGLSGIVALLDIRVTCLSLDSSSNICD